MSKFVSIIHSISFPGGQWGTSDSEKSGRCPHTHRHRQQNAFPGHHLQDHEYTVFTSISGFLPWIKSSIKDNGGMASCDASFSVPPSKGCSNYSIKNSYNKLNKKRQAFCRKISGASNSAWTSRPWRSIQRGATLLC